MNDICPLEAEGLQDSPGPSQRINGWRAGLWSTTLEVFGRGVRRNRDEKRIDAKEFFCGCGFAAGRICDCGFPAGYDSLHQDQHHVVSLARYFRLRWRKSLPQTVQLKFL